MEPVGPWSAYAQYNRLAGVPSNSSSAAAELHHIPTTTGSAVPPTTTAQILSGSFLSPPAVGYETVFSPLFHHPPGTKPGHYVTQVPHRAQALVQQVVANKGDGEYHQQFFEQGAGAAWQQNSPFGILPHESVVPTTTTKSNPYENFNPHFAAQSLNHLNTQLAAANIKVTARAQSPQVSTTSKTTQSNSTFYQVPSTYSVSDSASNSKTFTTNANIQPQSCIVSQSNNAPPKEYRVPQPPVRQFVGSPNPPPNRPIEKFPNKQNAVQSKNQKTYSELTSQSERSRNSEEQGQSSPISFSVIDAASGRVNYSGTNSSNKRTTQFPHGNYRHYPNAGSEQDFQRPKAGSEYSSTNGPDCNVVVPRRPSPLQAHSQASPLGHAQSPAYPLYNSPMSSISSPQQVPSNQVTPPSPLDVSVPRPNSQSNNVAYSSVITRNLNTEKNYTERYERSAQGAQGNTQNCWEDRSPPPNRKFPTGQYNSNTSNNNLDIQRAETQRVTLNITERQQAYFDTNTGHQVTLQDLSSCRGDPMSLVKNLQQQNCQVQTVEVKQETPVKQPAKRRKSNDKANVIQSDAPGRIPPPAHSTPPANPQQQNGTFIEFDRWNIPPSSAKIFATQSIHQQSQIMVPHGHAHHPPPLPYFAPFHLAAPPGEFVELQPIGGYNTEQNAQTNGQQYNSHQPSQQPPPPQEDPAAGKVVVPNIEEELNFLSDAGTVKPPSNPTAKVMPMLNSKPVDKPTGPGAGFMSSYLKFLQGERDTSPPPAARASRKQTWINKPTTTVQKSPGEENKPVESNGIPPVPIVPPPPPITITRLSQGDPQDDPRYFPLPKERKNNSFDSSDGLSSDDDFFAPKVTPPPPVEKKKKEVTVGAKKGRPPKPGGSSEAKKNRQQEALLKKQAKEKAKEEKLKEKKEKELEKIKIKASGENVPRRESVKRAAKDKKKKDKTLKEDDDLEEPLEFQDSDSDPAWTPVKDPEEEPLQKPKKRGRGSGKKAKMKNLISAAIEGAGINENDGYSSETNIKNNRKQKTSNKTKQNVPPTLEDNIAASLNRGTMALGEDIPFKPGEFVVIKADLKKEWPPIWRVDGKSLLQKYEPFEQSNCTLYRNIPTFSSWCPENKKKYMSVPVKFRSHTPTETIVEFLKEEMTIIDYEYQESCMKESEKYQDNFEVYIQTLISQALDSNFLTEIFQEQDDYFLSNVKTIDEITESRKNSLLTLVKWPLRVQAAVCTWPCFNIIKEVHESDAHTKLCVSCNKLGVSVRVLMYGQPYNVTTLEGCQPDPKAINEKDFLMCRICSERVELMNKITHQKYLMYIECAKRVSEKRSTDPNKDTTCILNELLADESWLNQLFLEVRTYWSEVDCITHSYKIKNNSVQ